MLDDDDDDQGCRILRGGAWYLRSPPRGGQDANCEQDGVRPQFGFRLAHDSASRVVRGGSEDSDPPHARVAYSFSRDPARRYGDLGFRLVWDRP
jgi:formylglycine-generating enzyme required for sulfatase activity